MTMSHFPYCQPDLEDDESGFLRVGRLPERNVEDFHMLLNLIGIPVKPKKLKKKQDSEESCDGADSDDFEFTKMRKALQKPSKSKIAQHEKSKPMTKP